jgi:hypothetical protein
MLSRRAALGAQNLFWRFAIFYEYDLLTHPFINGLNSDKSMSLDYL